MPRLLIIQDYLRHGGTESHTVWLAGAMRAAGIDASILTHRPGGPLSARAAESGVPVRALQPVDCRLDWLAPGRVGAIRDIRPETILLMGKVANAGARGIRHRFPDIRLVGSVRTGHALPWYVRRALPACDAVVCNARTIADTLPPFGVAPDAIAVIPNPPVLPPLAPDAATRASVRETYGAPADTVVSLCVAGFRSGKGQASLIRALAAMSAPARARVALWLAGDGETRGACEALAVALGVADRVRFLGHAGDPRALYLAADLAVMASAAEALPNFLIEAQSHGLPVVSWDVGGVRETFLSGRTGTLTPPGDEAALAAAWAVYVEAPGRLAEAGAEARAWAPTVFSAEAATAAYRRVFGF